MKNHILIYNNQVFPFNIVVVANGLIVPKKENFVPGPQWQGNRGPG